jgi:hypothetical protein
MTPLRADASQIARALAVLFDEGDVIELRIPKTEREGTVSGYFRDRAALAKQLASRNGDVAVYVTLNPVVPSLLARCANRVRSRARTTTSDKDIATRRWLLVDCDPVRPAEISSTDAEHEAALERARALRFELGENGWPVPVLADSGNGAHLLYRIDLPNDEPAAKLIEGVLKALAARFNDAAVKVDETVFNAARVTKAYGTVARKGDDLPDRPHRLSRILDVPSSLESVPRELLEQLVPRIAPPAPPRSTWAKKFSIETFLAQHLVAREPVAHDGGRKWVLEECPFNPEHKAPDAAIFELADGSFGFKCFHDSCQGKTWKDVRRKYQGARAQSGHRVSVDINALPPSIDSLNALPFFQGLLEFRWLRRRGTLVRAGFADGTEVIWRSAADLMTFARAQAALFEGTGILIATPNHRLIKSIWEPVAQLIRRVADQDSVVTGPPLQEEFAELLRAIWEQADRPVIETPEAFAELLQLANTHRRDPTQGPPRCCIWIAEESCWIHSRSLLDWLSTPGGKNRQYPWADVREALLLLEFKPRLLHRWKNGIGVSTRVWQGPLDLLADDET